MFATPGKMTFDQSAHRSGCDGATHVNGILRLINIERHPHFSVFRRIKV
ncbi:hypothetical protein [Enterovibrio sp. FF113]